MQAKKKRVWSVVAALAVLIAAFGAAPLTADAAEPIRVILDGETLEFDVQPTIINDRTMVPMRAIFEALGAEVGWEPSSRTISAAKDDILVVTRIGDETIYVNDERKTMDVAPVIVDSRTLVPIRFVSEALGCDVKWIDSERTVIISSIDNQISDLPSPVSDEDYRYDPADGPDVLDN